MWNKLLKMIGRIFIRLEYWVQQDEEHVFYAMIKTKGLLGVSGCAYINKFGEPSYTIKNPNEYKFANREQAVAMCKMNHDRLENAFQPKYERIMFDD